MANTIGAGPPRKRQVVIVSRVKRNPYVTLLCEGLNQKGLNLQARVEDQFSLRWLRQQHPLPDVIHIHWLELLYTYPGLARSLKRWLSVMAALLLARLRGVCLIYTLHNIWQHEGQRRWLTRLANRVMFALAQGVHVHDDETAAALAARWGRRRGVHVIPHGNYVSAYANNISRPEARARLSLEQARFVYLFLGRIRPYKGLEELIEAFRCLPQPDVALVVAGEAQEPAYAAQVQTWAALDPRIHLHLAFVADDDVQVFMQASDVCVLPYRHVTTSGAAILAFSFGVPIVAPRLGCFRELVGQNERGVLYDMQNPDGLSEALEQAQQCDLPALQAASRSYAADLDWRVISQRHARMYASCDQDR